MPMLEEHPEVPPQVLQGIVLRSLLACLLKELMHSARSVYADCADLYCRRDMRRVMGLCWIVGQHLRISQRMLFRASRRL